MRIGIDFDNTIACYDDVFHTAAVKRDLIPASLPTDKNTVRDYLNGSGRKDAFTELQGYVYGECMDLVAPYKGFHRFVADALRKGHELYIVSHKTRYPIYGQKYDLHKAARDFLRAQGISGNGPEHIIDAHIFFELTKEEKVARANTLNVDVFIDDLPEVLTMPGFPEQVNLILFAPPPSPLENIGDRSDILVCRNWREILQAVLGSET